MTPDERIDELIGSLRLLANACLLRAATLQEQLSFDSEGMVEKSPAIGFVQEEEDEEDLQ